MKIVFEIIGVFVFCLIWMAIPILCSLSFAYNWYPGIKLILSIACFAEWIGLICQFSKGD